jgi:hypothetical protein
MMQFAAFGLDGGEHILQHEEHQREDRASSNATYIARSHQGKRSSSEPASVMGPPTLETILRNDITPGAAA